jgi:ABC-type ATPase with predicted acetyltransferase domain
MMYQRTLQKLTTEEFITESDDEVVAMWERNHMATMMRAQTKPT